MSGEEEAPSPAENLLSQKQFYAMPQSDGLAFAGRLPMGRQTSILLPTLRLLSAFPAVVQ